MTSGYHSVRDQDDMHDPTMSMFEVLKKHSCLSGLWVCVGVPRGEVACGQHGAALFPSGVA